MLFFISTLSTHFIFTIMIQRKATGIQMLQICVQPFMHLTCSKASSFAYNEPALDNCIFYSILSNLKMLTEICSAAYIQGAWNKASLPWLVLSRVQSSRDFKEDQKVSYCGHFVWWILMPLIPFPLSINCEWQKPHKSCSLDNSNCWMKVFTLFNPHYAACPGSKMRLY